VTRDFVSVVVPVHNGERFLSEAIDSVRAQRHEALEIVVVDDGSTDGTPEVITSLRGGDLRSIRQENRGPAAARNRGIELARGDVIGFLDADDVWSPGSLGLRLAHIDGAPPADIVIGWHRYLREVPSSDGKPDAQELGPIGFFFHFSAALVRRSVFETVGPIDESMWFGEDLDWFSRAWERDMSMLVVDAPTVLYRRHDRNMTLDREETARAFLVSLKKSLDRRRASGPALPLSKLRRVHVEGVVLPDV
jgi:glycosyltransferase involved in cell wall biosynthesis